MKNSSKRIVPILLALLIIASLVWYCFVYDRDFTRDMLLNQARHQSTSGNPKVASWFYDLAYEHSGQDESVAIELANQFKAAGNYTKAEYTLSNAIADGGTAELYIALCKTYVEKDKLQDAVNMLDNIGDPTIKAEIDALRPSAPTANPPAGYYSQYIPVELASSFGTIYYSTDGEYPSTDDEPYAEPFILGGGETTVMAVSVAENGLVSPRSIFGFTVGGVIEAVYFDDPAIENAVRLQIGREDVEPLISNELWEIASFTVPQDAKSCDDLTRLIYLNSLVIDGQELPSLRFLSSLTELRELTLNGCRIQSEDLQIIAALPNLQRLTLNDCGISTVAGLEKAQNLTYLNLANNTIRNLEPIAQLMNLEKIDLQHNALTNLSSLGGLSNLEELNVSYNSLTSVAPLATCTKLTWLDASNNDLVNLDGIDNLPELIYLAVNQNALTDVSVLAGVKTLKELYVSNNEIKEITDLSALMALEVFNFSGNKVKELPAWPSDGMLRVIDGSNNVITSLKNLKNQMNLTHVYMDYNKITSVSALKDCYKLVLVNVYGNEIESVKELTDLEIIVNWDPT